MHANENEFSYRHLLKELEELASASETQYQLSFTFWVDYREHW